MTGDTRHRSGRPWFVAAVLALALAGSGCFRAHFVNGTEPSPAPTATYEWYLTLAWVVDLRGPVDFAEVCPGGDWSELSMAWGPLGAIVSFFTLTILVPQTTTVICPGGYRVEGTAVDGKMARIHRVYVPQTPPGR